MGKQGREGQCKAVPLALSPQTPTLARPEPSAAAPSPAQPPPLPARNEAAEPGEVRDRAGKRPVMPGPREQRALCPPAPSGSGPSAAEPWTKGRDPNRIGTWIGIRTGPGSDCDRDRDRDRRAPNRGLAAPPAGPAGQRPPALGTRARAFSFFKEIGLI